MDYYYTLETYSLEGLCYLAETLLFQFAAANTPREAQRFSAKVLPIHSIHCVSASGCDVAMDFASSTVRALIMEDVTKADILLTEAWDRMVRDDDYPLRLMNTLTSLEREMRTFLNAQRGTALLRVEDFSGFSRELGVFFGTGARPD